MSIVTNNITLENGELTEEEKAQLSRLTNPDEQPAQPIKIFSDDQFLAGSILSDLTIAIELQDAKPYSMMNEPYKTAVKTAYKFISQYGDLPSQDTLIHELNNAWKDHDQLIPWITKISVCIKQYPAGIAEREKIILDALNWIAYNRIHLEFLHHLENKQPNVFKLHKLTTEAVESQSRFSSLISLEDYFQRKRVPTFPVEVINDICPTMHDMCVTIAHHLQVPIDLPCSLALAIVGMTIMGDTKVEIAPETFIDCPIWTMTVLPPGERKSPALERLIAPVKKYVKAWNEDHKWVLQKADRDKAIYSSRLNNLQKQAAKAKQDDVIDVLDEIAECERKLKAAEEIKAMRLLIDDATPEATAEVLYENGGKIACITDEATFLEIAAGRYGQPNYELYLKAWSGQEYTIDRKRQAALFIENAYLTLGLAVQPDVLLGLASDPLAVDRGFLPRFLMSMPESTLGQRITVEDRFPTEVIDKWESLIVCLLKQSKKRLLRINLPKANAWAQSFESRLGRNGDLSAISGWVAKAMNGQMVRVAAVLHAAAGEEGDIIADKTLEAAMRIIEYYLAHTQQVFSMASNAALYDLCKQLRQHLIESKDDVFTHRTICQNHKSLRYVDKDLLEEAYDVLVETNHLRVLGENRKKKATYKINPLLRH